MAMHDVAKSERVGLNKQAARPYSRKGQANRGLLLVESDRTASELLESTLGTRGFSVHTARGVEEALEITSHCAPRFAIVDLCIPGRSELDLVAKLRTADPRIKIVTMTACPSIAIAVEAIKRGAIGYLIKPVDAYQIVCAFRKVRGKVPADLSFKPRTELMNWRSV